MINTGFTGKLLDRYLASGWYRMGARMFTCRYNFYANGFLTTVWTRLPLAGHAFPKRVRKLIRRNRARFTHQIHPAQATDAEEAVFIAYRATKDYDLQNTAAHYLRHDPDVPFDTYQVSVFDDDRLVAFSYFDRGGISLQSIAGYYDPAYASHSLGLYTMALEVEKAKAWGMTYHYAGYLVPGNEIFEYKRKVGDLEAFDDVSRVWYPLGDLDPTQLPDAVQRAALLEYDELYRSVAQPYALRFRPNIQIPFGRTGLSWLRREQFPFCIVDSELVGAQYWACHLYSYNYGRYFTLLCTHPLKPAPMSLDEPMPNPGLGLEGLFEHYELGTGVAVECLHYATHPYTSVDLERIQRTVIRANTVDTFAVRQSDASYLRRRGE